MQRGFSLATVLLVAAVALVVAFSMAALTTTHLSFASEYASGQDALYLAEAAVNQTMENLSQDAAYGSKADQTVKVQPDPANDRRVGLVEFRRDAGVPYSTNNFDGSNNVGWNGTSVAAGTSQIVATGRAGTVTRTVEAVVNVPQFPYVLATAGAFQADGRLEVKAASSLADFVSSAGASAVLPATMASNTSVHVTGLPCQVSGDVIAPGAISLPPGAEVDGRVQTGVVDIPNLDSAKFSSTLLDHPNRVAASSPDAVLSLSNRNDTAGDLVVNGDLVLNNASLYVNGNLHVTGGVSGSGMLVVRGTTQIDEGADLTAAGLVALVSDGDVTIGQPGSTAKKFFEGLVYTRGVFTASSLTIAGVFIAASSASGATAGPQMHLSNVPVVHLPDAATLHLRFGGAVAPKDILFAEAEAEDTYVSSPSFKPLLASVNRYYVGKSFQPTGLSPGLSPWNNYVRWTEPTLMFQDPASQSRVLMEVRLASRSGSPDGDWGGGIVRYGDPNGTGSSHFYTAVPPGHVARLSAVSGCEDTAILDGGSRIYVHPVLYVEHGAAVLSFRYLGLTDAQKLAREHGTSLEEMIQAQQDSLPGLVDTANKILKGSIPVGDSGGGSIDLTLNQFLSDKTPIHVLSWRVH